MRVCFRLTTLAAPGLMSCLVLFCFLFVDFLILFLDHFPNTTALFARFSEHLWIIILNSLWAIPGSPVLWGQGLEVYHLPSGTPFALALRDPGSPVQGSAPMKTQPPPSAFMG